MTHTNKPKSIIVMKVGPHSGMSLEEIIKSKQEEEKIYGVHFWGYSGVFCQPGRTQEFCRQTEAEYGELPKLVLITTKSAYSSEIGFIHLFSEDGITYREFEKPVQLQGAKYSFVTKGLERVEDFSLSDYAVVGGKNEGLPLQDHLRYRVNKSFARLASEETGARAGQSVLMASFAEPDAMWFKE